MRILVLYNSPTDLVRNTQNEHLYSFSRYSSAHVEYYNVFDGVSLFLFERRYDLIIFHYTFMSIRWNGGLRFRKTTQKLGKFRSSKAIKVALPQDEYLHSTVVCEFLRDLRVNYVFTCAIGETISKLYPPDKIGDTKVMTTFPGFVDDVKNAGLAFDLDHSVRPIDISYRARSLPFWLGRHGCLKKDLATAFLSQKGLSDFKTDISVEEKDTILGDNWLKFIANSRVVLGCEGGASLHDPDGSIRNKVDAFVESHPLATFSEVEENCFPKLDGNLKLYSISPRHFEAALTKTCQVLVEGHYHGVLKPGVHYIELKSDFSNIEQVFTLIKDKSFCEQVALRAYQDLILSGKYSYGKFVDEILGLVERQDKVDETSFDRIIGWWLFQARPKIYRPIFRVLYALKVVVVKFLRRFNLLFYFKKIRSKIWGHNIEI